MYNEMYSPVILPPIDNGENPCEKLEDLEKEQLGLEDEFDAESATFMQDKPAGYKPKEPQDTSKCAP